VDVEACTLTAVVATNPSRVIDIYDDDLDAWITVEEIVLVEGMDFSRVESRMQFLDNHDSWEREANLGVVLEARVEDLDGVGPVVVADIKMSSRPELDSLVQDLADGIVGCISCQYRPIENTLELRKDQHPLLTHTKSELLEVSLVSVPADPNALVRSERSLKRQNMAGKPQGARDAAKRALAARTAKRAAGTTVDTLDDAAIVDAVIEEVVPAVVEEVTAAVGDNAGTERSDEHKAKAEADAKAAEEAKIKSDAAPIPPSAR
jgi:phage head maturation protease